MTTRTSSLGQQGRAEVYSTTFRFEPRGVYKGTTGPSRLQIDTAGGSLELAHHITIIAEHQVQEDAEVYRVTDEASRPIAQTDHDAPVVKAVRLA